MLADSRSSSGSFDSCNLICHLLYHSFRTDHKIMAWVSGNIALNQCENHAQNWVLLMFILGWLCCVCHRQCLSECEFSESSVMLILSNRIQRPSCIVNDIFTEMWRSTVEQFLIHNYCLKYQKRVLTFYHSSCVLLVCISLYTCVLWCIDLFQFFFLWGFFFFFLFQCTQSTKSFEKLQSAISVWRMCTYAYVLNVSPSSSLCSMLVLLVSFRIDLLSFAVVWFAFFWWLFFICILILFPCVITFPLLVWCKVQVLLFPNFVSGWLLMKLFSSVIIYSVRISGRLACLKKIYL